MKKVDKSTGRVGICQRERFKDRWKDEHVGVEIVKVDELNYSEVKRAHAGWSGPRRVSADF